MRRRVTRILLASFGVALLVIGAGAIALGLVANTTFTQAGAIRTDSQSIEAPGCATLLVELATARVDVGEWGRIPLAERRTALTITPSGSTAVPWLVGAADRRDIEQRLLGARYCLAQRIGSGWSVSSIAVGESDPDVRLDGVRGLWAHVRDGQPVQLPVPSAPSTVVVSGQDASSLSTVEIVGEIQFEGGDNVARIALLGGIASMVLGLVLLVVGIAGLRRKGRHEGPTAPADDPGLGGAT